MELFSQICQDIKAIRIQGAEHIARAAVIALKLKHTPESIKILRNLRPTEPTLQNALDYALRFGVDETVSMMDGMQEKITATGKKYVHDNTIVFTHCHSSTVTDILRKAKEGGKQFIVHNTETRPLYQGRKTSMELASLHIQNKHFVDSAMGIAMKDANVCFVGADAITSHFVYNKIGSRLAAEIAYNRKIPFYICASSWKTDPKAFAGKETVIEYRSGKEVWDTAPKGVEIMNPAFEQIDPKMITGIICEFGVVSLTAFVKKVKKYNPWMF